MAYVQYSLNVFNSSQLGAQAFFSATYRLHLHLDQAEQLVERRVEVRLSAATPGREARRLAQRA